MAVSGNELIRKVAQEDVDFGVGATAEGNTKVNALHVPFSTGAGKTVDQLFSGTAIQIQCANPSTDAQVVNKGFMDSAISAGVAGSIIGKSEGLEISYSNATTITVDYSRIQVTSTSGDSVLLSKPSAPLSAVISVVGAGGLDTGAEANSTWYYIWVIYDSSGGNATKALLSVNPTSPTMPSGYTHKSLVSAVFNNSSGNFSNFHQTSNEYQYNEVLPAHGGSNFTANIKDDVPYALVKSVRGYIRDTGSPSSYNITVSPSSSFVGYQYETNGDDSINYHIMPTEKTTSAVNIYITTSPATSLNLFVMGFDLKS